ncbi:beta-1,3-galactosyltransferase 1 [Elysia marginata]|uniref:Hexosyltransferase n=1 Tax=Elysia marginata TaxID=1093978 RepID=A0AAV4JFV8_9GAST|nr:beta-1,3-galactosyltransferase 1 [Elysia marginata]
MPIFPQAQKVIRSNSNKWFVSEQEYPFRFYPPWCKGYGVFMTRDVVKKLYLASSDIRDFWIDDVYVTGILAWRAGIQVRNFRQKHATVTHNQFENNDIHAMFVWATFTKRRSHRAYWKAMVAAQDRL